MVETFFGFKKPPFGDSPDAKQLFASQSWTQVKARLQFLVDHHGAGLLTGEVGAGKSTAARTFTAGPLAMAFLDRLVERAIVLKVKGKSYRAWLAEQAEKNSKKSPE